MTSIKKDALKRKWEDSTTTEFPLVCETCLGDNPYVRMTREAHGKPCATCETPFTVFAWQAGTKGRLKRVEICKSCARAKNVCQVCIYDLEYGLPVKVRDRVLAEGEGSGSGGGGGGSMAGIAVPQSDANRAWYNAQQAQALTRGDNNNTSSSVGPRTIAKLQSMARMEPRYERNLPKLCSFFAVGECNRGKNCPFRHEMPKDRNDPLSHQNTKDRFYGTNDPVANAILGRRREKMEAEREKQRLLNGGKDGPGGGTNGDVGDERAVSTVYVRFDTKDPSTSSILISESDVRDGFYSYGEIASVRLHSDVGAFVEYTTGDSASLAIASQNRKQIKGRMILVNWARQKKRGVAMNQRGGGGGGGGGGGMMGPVRPLPPPTAMGVRTCIPVGFTPSAQVAAAAKARVVRTSGLAATGLADGGASGGTGGGGGTGVPRPGGGAIRRIGMGIGRSMVRDAAPKPYYASADPGRLGSRSTTSTGAGE